MCGQCDFTLQMLEWCVVMAFAVISQERGVGLSQCALCYVTLDKCVLLTMCVHSNVTWLNRTLCRDGMGYTPYRDDRGGNGVRLGTRSENVDGTGYKWEKQAWDRLRQGHNGVPMVSSRHSYHCAGRRAAEWDGVDRLPAKWYQIRDLERVVLVLFEERLKKFFVICAFIEDAAND